MEKTDNGLAILKPCRICGEEKTLGEYQPSRLRRRDYICRACNTAAKKEARKP